MGGDDGEERETHPVGKALRSAFSIWTPSGSSSADGWSKCAAARTGGAVPRDPRPTRARAGARRGLRGTPAGAATEANMTSLLSTGRPPEKPRARVCDQPGGREKGSRATATRAGSHTTPPSTAPSRVPIRMAPRRERRGLGGRESHPKIELVQINICEAYVFLVCRISLGICARAARASVFAFGRNIREIVSTSVNLVRAGAQGCAREEGASERFSSRERRRRGRRKRGFAGSRIAGARARVARASRAGFRVHVWPFSPAPRKSERKPPASDDPGGGGRARRPRRGARDRANRGLETRRTPTEQVRHHARRM